MEEEPMLMDEQVDYIESWLAGIKQSIEQENISYSELLELEHVVETLKGE